MSAEQQLYAWSVIFLPAFSLLLAIGIWGVIAIVIGNSKQSKRKEVIDGKV
jgi:hypothetical protein